LLIIRSFAKFLIEVDSENVFISQISSTIINVVDDGSNNTNAPSLTPSNSIDNDDSDLQQQQQQTLNQCHDILYQLINSLFEICISIPVE
jgi:hypothetical protein